MSTFMACTAKKALFLVCREKMIYCKLSALVLRFTSGVRKLYVTVFLIFKDYDPATSKSSILQETHVWFLVSRVLMPWVSHCLVHQNSRHPKLDIALQVLSGPTECSRTILNHFITITLCNLKV